MALLDWLRARYYRHHTAAAVPASIASRHVALPAVESPAAGWLLPRSGTATTVRDGVIYRKLLYVHPTFAARPGMLLPVREFPYYPVLAHVIIVERDVDGEPAVDYLARAERAPDVM